MPSKFEAVLFDLDGTLIDSLPDIVRSVNVLRRERGLGTITRGQVLKGVGRGAEFLLRACLPDYSLGERGHRALLEDVARYQQAYSAGPSRSKAFAGVQKGLLKFQKENPYVKLGIVTNKPTNLAREALKNCLPGVDFAQIRGPETVSQRKPHPAHVLETLRDLSVPAARSVLVGDDPIDAKVAAASGVAFVGVEWGYGNLQQGAESALGICQRFEDVINYLNQ